MGDDAQIVLQASGQIKAGIVLQSGGTNAYAQKLWTGKASVLEGKGVDGKGGTSSKWREDGANRVVSGRKASFRAGTAVNGVADRIEKCASGGTGFTDSAEGYDSVAAVKSLKNVLVTSYTADAEAIAEACSGSAIVGTLSAGDLSNFGKHEAKLLAECMESKVGGVFLKSHTEAMAADCVAIVLPELSPKRAKRLGTYWQTPEQLTRVTAGPGETQQ